MTKDALASLRATAFVTSCRERRTPLHEVPFQARAFLGWPDKFADETRHAVDLEVRRILTGVKHREIERDAWTRRQPVKAK